jgi:hypothetical protein
MYCGRCCATEPRLRAALRLDIFIEILLGTLVSGEYDDGVECLLTLAVGDLLGKSG